VAGSPCTGFVGWWLTVVGALPPGAGGRVPLYGFCGLVVNTLKRGGFVVGCLTTCFHCWRPPTRSRGLVSHSGNTLLAWFLVLWLVTSHLGSISASLFSGRRALPPGAGGRVPLYGFCGLVVNTLKRGGSSYCGGPPGNTLIAWFLVLWLVPSHLGSISGSPVSG
jgi:hypothetical protein